MKTKNIFHTLALAMLTLTMLLTSACSNSDELAAGDTPTENTLQKGYSLPVTVNVTCQSGDAAMRAVYDATEKKLSFSTGDQLFVTGSHTTAGQFAGSLEWVSGGTFSGNLNTQNEYTGTAEELLNSASYAKATLLPAGYAACGFLSIIQDGFYNARLESSYDNAYASTKKEAVSQLSYEQGSYTAGTGFALVPQNAILSFTISNLDAGEDTDISFKFGVLEITKTSKASASGEVTFGLALSDGAGRAACSLEMRGKTSGKRGVFKFGTGTFEAGHIYNSSKEICSLLSAATSADHGKVVCAAGHLHPAKTAVPTSCTAVGILGKVTSTGHGLILALKDAQDQSWNTINSWTDERAYADTELRILPNAAARGTNLASYTELGATTVSDWAVPQKSDYEAIFKNLGTTKYDAEGWTYDGHVNAYFTTDVGGTALSNYYWSNTKTLIGTWAFYGNWWAYQDAVNSYHVRPVLAF